MADIRLGNNNTVYKVGSGDCTIYLGTTLLYPHTPPTPVFTGKWKATYSDSHIESAACDSSSALTSGDTTVQGYEKSGMTSAVIGDCVTSLGIAVFSGCSSLSSVTIPNSVTSINVAAFYGCSGLTSVTLPDSLTSLWGDVFGYCSSLTSIDIPSGVTSLGRGTFAYCSSLSSVTIPSNVTSIGADEFLMCSSLTGITIPSGVTIIDSGTFSHCSGLTSIDLPSGLTSIGLEAFRDTSLTNLVIPDSVTSIGASAFYQCSGLTSCTIGSGVTSIGLSAFGWCSGLTSIEIPDNVTSIGDYAFYRCSGLTSITINATTPPTLGSDVFYSTNNCPIYVPSGSVSAYQSAWSTYASRIQAIPSQSQCTPSSSAYTYLNTAISADTPVYGVKAHQTEDTDGEQYNVYLTTLPNESGDTYRVHFTYVCDEYECLDWDTETQECMMFGTDCMQFHWEYQIYSGNSVYITSGTGQSVNFCETLGFPLYVTGEPERENCIMYECVEYCCNEWDEETGECIDYSPDCCGGDICTQYETQYIMAYLL